MIVEFPDGSRSIFVHPQTHFVMNLESIILPVVNSRQSPASLLSREIILTTNPRGRFRLFYGESNGQKCYRRVINPPCHRENLKNVSTVFVK